MRPHLATAKTPPRIHPWPVTGRRRNRRDGNDNPFAVDECNHLAGHARQRPCLLHGQPGRALSARAFAEDRERHGRLFQLERSEPRASEFAAGHPARACHQPGRHDAPAARGYGESNRIASGDRLLHGVWRHWIFRALILTNRPIDPDARFAGKKILGDIHQTEFYSGGRLHLSNRQRHLAATVRAIGSLRASLFFSAGSIRAFTDGKDPECRRCRSLDRRWHGEW